MRLLTKFLLKLFYELVIALNYDSQCDINAAKSHLLSEFTFLC
jgi:hypothetical protein